MKLQESNLVTGIYNDIIFEISKPVDNYEFYNYYIYIVLDFIEDDDVAEELWLEPMDGTIIPERPRKRYPYLENDLLIDLDFHGGITYYSKGFDSEDRRRIKIGCDYNHLSDQYRVYNQSEVISDIKNTIDDFLNKVDYKLPKFLRG